MPKPGQHLFSDLDLGLLTLAFCVDSTFVKKKQKKKHQKNLKISRCYNDKNIGKYAWLTSGQDKTFHSGAWSQLKNKYPPYKTTSMSHKRHLRSHSLTRIITYFSRKKEWMRRHIYIYMQLSGRKQLVFCALYCCWMNIFLTVCILITKYLTILHVERRYLHCSVIQWNLSVTTTSTIKVITCDLFSNCFNDKWRYQFTRVDNFCLLELI